MFGIEDTVVEAVVASTLPENVGEATTAERFARAAWSTIAEPGDTVAVALIDKVGAVEALDLLLNGKPLPELDEIHADVAAEAVKRWRPRASVEAVLVTSKLAARFHVKHLVPSDPAWPAGLDDLLSPPYGLWLRGSEEVFGTLDQSVSLTGARAATGYGEHLAMEISAALVDKGWTILSGAAYGIDGQVHRSALAARGNTVAVLAGGVDRFYPAGHDALLQRIVEAGAVVSELPPGSQPTKWRFLLRNRLIAAMSQGTVVIEAGWRSGSLNTAGHAIAMGRPVGAVPGPVTSAASAGCHRLISEGSTLVTNAGDIERMLDPLADQL